MAHRCVSRLHSWSGLVIPMAICGVAASRANAISVSGTITYAGQQDPVSANRPIQVAIGNQSNKIGKLGQATVTANEGSFALEVPAPGDYFLGYYVDVIPDGHVDVGEPFQIYNGRFNPTQADALPVPDSGVTGLDLQFDDTGIVSGIGGTVTYTGTLGEVSATSQVRVQAFSDPSLSLKVNEQGFSTNGARYDLPTFDMNTYFLWAFLDLNGNHAHDSGEPYTIYQNKGSPPANPVGASTTQTAVDMTFGDENVLSTPTPTPTLAPSLTPTPTPTPKACVGDCSGDEEVTVDELLAMVNIALGNALVVSCAAGDANHDLQITVDEILTAVNNALTGCVGFAHKVSSKPARFAAYVVESGVATPFPR